MFLLQINPTVLSINTIRYGPIQSTQSLREFSLALYLLLMESSVLFCC